MRLLLFVCLFSAVPALQQESGGSARVVFGGPNRPRDLETSMLKLNVPFRPGLSVSVDFDASMLVVCASGSPNGLPASPVNSNGTCAGGPGMQVTPQVRLASQIVSNSSFWWFSVSRNDIHGSAPPWPYLVNESLTFLVQNVVELQYGQVTQPFDILPGETMLFTAPTCDRLKVKFVPSGFGSLTVAGASVGNASEFEIVQNRLESVCDEYIPPGGDCILSRFDNIAGRHEPWILRAQASDTQNNTLVSNSTGKTKQLALQRQFVVTPLTEEHSLTFGVDGCADIDLSSLLTGDNRVAIFRIDGSLSDSIGLTCHSKFPFFNLTKWQSCSIDVAPYVSSEGPSSAALLVEMMQGSQMPYKAYGPPPWEVTAVTWATPMFGMGGNASPWRMRLTTNMTANEASGSVAKICAIPNATVLEYGTKFTFYDSAAFLDPYGKRAAIDLPALLELNETAGAFGLFYMDCVADNKMVDCENYLQVYAANSTFMMNEADSEEFSNGKVAAPFVNTYTNCLPQKLFVGAQLLGGPGPPAHPSNLSVNITLPRLVRVPITPGTQVTIDIAPKGESCFDTIGISHSFLQRD